MANYFDQFDEPKGGNYFDQFDPPGTPFLTTKPKQKQNSGLLADTATDVKRGFEQLPGAATGLLDIPAGIAGFDRIDMGDVHAAVARRVRAAECVEDRVFRLGPLPAPP